MKILFCLLFLLSISAQASKNFVYCSEASPSSFNPQLASDGPSFNASSHTIYDRLLSFVTGSTNIEPGLAESYTVSKNGLSFTFKLRKGVKFHSNEFFKPTRDFNADDVLFTFNRMMQPSHPFHKVGGGTYEYFESMDMRKIIKQIKKVDSHTVVFELSRKEAPFVANMAMDFASILSAEYGELLLKKGTPEKIDTLPIGTGPFIFKSYSKDTLIRYTANKDYFQGAPKIENLIFAITPDSSVRYQKLKAGECHLIAEPSPSDISAMQKNSKLAVLEKEGLNVGYLAMNIEKAPLNNKKIREAIGFALNRQAYLDAIYMGRAKLAKNPIPPTIWSYEDKTKEFEYNPEKAKQLVAESGVKNIELELWTMPVARPYNPNGKKMGELMQADLAKIGIKVKLVTYDWPTYLAKARKGEHQLLQLGWVGDNGDPDNFFNVLLGCAAVDAGSNYSRWCFKPFESLVENAKQTSDVVQRTAMYKKAQGIFRDEVPWVPLVHAKVYRAMAKGVVGYQIHPFGSDIFTKVDLH